MSNPVLPPCLGFTEIFLRLLCAMAVGSVIGTEREYANRPAGLRTHILVALGACSVMLTGQLVFAQYSAYGASPDPARLAAQVITGVGFLGAGTILKEGPTVHGLTTAASLWTVACLGVAAGGGYYAVALTGMVFIFITLTLLELLQHRLLSDGVPGYYAVEMEDISAGLDSLNTHAQQQGASVCDMRILHQKEHYCVVFRCEIAGFHSKKRRHALIAGLASEAGILSIRQLRREEFSTSSL